MKKKYICNNCGREVESALIMFRTPKCKDCKTEMKEVKEDIKKVIHKEPKQRGWVPVLGGEDSEDFSGNFLINGKSVQGVPSKDNSMLEFVKRAFDKGYKSHSAN